MDTCCYLLPRNSLCTDIINMPPSQAMGQQLQLTEVQPVTTAATAVQTEHDVLRDRHATLPPMSPSVSGASSQDDDSKTAAARTMSDAGWRDRVAALEAENAQLAAEVGRLREVAASAEAHTQQNAARQQAEQLKQVYAFFQLPCPVCVLVLSSAMCCVGPLPFLIVYVCIVLLCQSLMRLFKTHTTTTPQAGNNAFHQQQYAAAIQHYDAALSLGVQDARLAAVLHCNKAAALHEQGQYVDAVVQCCVAESHDPGYSRAFQRRAEAYAALGDFAAALRVRACTIMWFRCMHLWWCLCVLFVCTDAWE